MKLNLGCGRNILEGYVNVDRFPGPGVDLVADLEKCDAAALKGYKGELVEEMLLSHVIEHITDSLGLMGKLYEAAKPGCKLVIRCPYGASDDAWEDPTHVRPYFLGSFYPFAQTYYWRADYGYRGDWQVKKIILAVRQQLVDQAKKSEDQIMQWVMMNRNIVTEMVAELVAVKPARAQKKELWEQPEIKLMAVK